MGDKTGIEWCDATWNPIVGCSVVSPGCTNCYAMKQAARIEIMDIEARAKRGDNLAVGGTHYAGTTKTSNAGPVWTGKVALAPEHIRTLPMRWKKPRVVFVNSMGDLFHEANPDEWIDQTFATMANSPRHTFIALTKRSKRMREYFTRWTLSPPADGFISRDGKTSCDAANGEPLFSPARWPLPNVILGVSAERQQEADERREDLGWLADRGWRTFVSYEPALGPVNWRGWEFLNGLIAGGESGPGARPMHPDWARSTRDQCAAAGVSFFFKQWGEWAPYDEDDGGLYWPADCQKSRSAMRAVEGHDVHNDPDRRWLIREPGEPIYDRVGKHRAGRLLNGREHNDLPWRLA